MTVVSDLHTARERLGKALGHLATALVAARFARLAPITLHGIQNAIDDTQTLRDRLDTIATREERTHLP